MFWRKRQTVQEYVEELGELLTRAHNARCAMVKKIIELNREKMGENNNDASSKQDTDDEPSSEEEEHKVSFQEVDNLKDDTGAPTEVASSPFPNSELMDSTAEKGMMKDDLLKKFYDLFESLTEENKLQFLNHAITCLSDMERLSTVVTSDTFSFLLPSVAEATHLHEIFVQGRKEFLQKIEAFTTTEALTTEGTSNEVEFMDAMVRFLARFDDVSKDFLQNCIDVLVKLRAMDKPKAKSKPKVKKAELSAAKNAATNNGKKKPKKE
jgi:hypothetical protein